SGCGLLRSRKRVRVSPCSDVIESRRRHATARAGRGLCRTVALRKSLDGARQTLDAVLVAPYEGHAPGTKLDAGIVVGVRWAQTGPPTGYELDTDRIGVRGR